MQLVEFINLVAAVLVGGFLSFLATQLVKQVSWPAWVKIVLSIIMAALFGIATAWINGDVWAIITQWGSLTSESVLVFAGLIWASATVWYRVVFKDADWAKSLGSWPKA